MCKPNLHGFLTKQAILHDQIGWQAALPAACLGSLCMV
jgi:hypothetical protein